MKRNLLIALVTLPFHLYVWFAYWHLSYNTLPFGRPQLNSLCASVVSIVLLVFVLLTLTVLLPSSKALAICLAVLIIVSHYVISGNVYRIRNVASGFIETNAAYQMGYATGLKSHQPPELSSVPMPPESTNWPEATFNSYSAGFADGMAAARRTN